VKLALRIFALTIVIAGVAGAATTQYADSRVRPWAANLPLERFSNCDTPKTNR